jgi:hypothetical protein
MHLREALGHDNEVDPTQPLKIGNYTFGIEAASEAAKILSEGLIQSKLSVHEGIFNRPIYWSVTHETNGDAEIFGFPKVRESELPTAIEVAIVRALAASPIDQHQAILDGGFEVFIGHRDAFRVFCEISAVVRKNSPPILTEFNKYTSARIVSNTKGGLKTALECMLNSYSSSPEKFRFLELYRVLEAFFLEDVKSKLIAEFDRQPNESLNAALMALRSEMNQIILLAEPHKDLFEECWTELDAHKNSNTFAAALFRRLKDKGAHKSGKWETGASLIYQIRCAVVHSGSKDMIFERYADGEAAIRLILPIMERAALRMLGVTLS